MIEIPMPISQYYHIINGTNVIMAEITLEEETIIDNNDIIVLVKGDKTFTISKDKIFCYGDVDFINRNDLKTIENFKFVKEYVPYITRYDYEKHCSYSNNKKPMWSETNSSAQLALFAHGCLGKPKRIILFKL